MSFSGKATYSAGPSLPELVEDVSDLIGIISPHETPLLDHLGDPRRAALSTIHEWIEDELVANIDTINQSSFSPSPTTATTITVNNAERFRPGDLVQPDGSDEIMLVSGVLISVLTVVRGYGGTSAASLADGLTLRIIGNAALEGADALPPTFTNRVRRVNYTQIFTSTIRVSGSMQAARAHAVDDEVDYQKQERMRELLRDLENTVINGIAAASSPMGDVSVRRSMNGILTMLQTHRLAPGEGDLPVGGGSSEALLTEEMLNAAMERVWNGSSGGIDTIVVNGSQKRALNAFIGDDRRYTATDDTVRNLVSLYESDFGICRIVLSRWLPADAVLLLDSSRLAVLPLAGRSFHYKELASTGDAVSGQIIGEYTLEMRNENAHAVIRGLSTNGD